jgi:hypothetical protein
VIADDRGSHVLELLALLPLIALAGVAGLIGVAPHVTLRIPCMTETCGSQTNL